MSRRTASESGYQTGLFSMNYANFLEINNLMFKAWFNAVYTRMYTCQQPVNGDRLYVDNYERGLGRLAQSSSRLFKQVFDSPPGPRKSTQKIAIFTRYVQVKLLIIPRIFRLYMSY